MSLTTGRYGTRLFLLALAAQKDPTVSDVQFSADRGGTVALTITEREASR